MKGIYILTNRVSGNQYIGRAVDINRRVKRHISGREKSCRALHNAIKKHGADAFDVQRIPYPGISHEALNAVEKWKIAQLGTQSPNGYNLQNGGHNGTPSQETIEKIRQSNQGKPPWNKGKKWQKSVPAWNKGQPLRTATKQRISETKTGSKHSIRTKQKISDNHGMRGKPAWNKGQKGKPCSEETKRKMRETIRRRRLKAEWMYILSLAQLYYETQ